MGWLRGVGCDGAGRFVGCGLLQPGLLRGAGVGVARGACGVGAGREVTGGRGAGAGVAAGRGAGAGVDVRGAGCGFCRLVVPRWAMAGSVSSSNTGRLRMVVRRLFMGSGASGKAPLLARRIPGAWIPCPRGEQGLRTAVAPRLYPWLRRCLGGATLAVIVAFAPDQVVRVRGGGGARHAPVGVAEDSAGPRGTMGA